MNNKLYLSHSTQHIHPHIVDVLREPGLFFLLDDRQSGDFDDVDEQLFRSRVAAVCLVELWRARRRSVLLHDDDPVLGERRLASLEERREIDVGEMPENPLAPDDVVATRLRGERVQAAADVAVDPRRVLA